MTNIDILALARECGIGVHTAQAIASKDELLAFANAIIERCAAIADSVNNYDNPMTAHDVADAIRSMKAPTP